jgi:hypothetical protein
VVVVARQFVEIVGQRAAQMYRQMPVFLAVRPFTDAVETQRVDQHRAAEVDKTLLSLPDQRRVCLPKTLSELPT